MVKLTWKDKVRKFFGLGLTDETAMAIAQAEYELKQKAIAAEKARLEAAAKKKAEEEAAAKAKTTKVEKVKEAAAKTPSQPKKPAAKKTTTASTTKKATTAKKPAPKKVAYLLDAVDGDGDGLVQDGTPHERPATPKKKAPAKKKSSK